MVSYRTRSSAKWGYMCFMACLNFKNDWHDSEGILLYSRGLKIRPREISPSCTPEIRINNKYGALLHTIIVKMTLKMCQQAMKANHLV